MGCSSTTTAIGHGHCTSASNTTSNTTQLPGRTTSSTPTPALLIPRALVTPPAASATAAGLAEHSPSESHLSDPLKAERRKTNQLEKKILTRRQQLNRFSEINPEECVRLGEAERQKQILEQQMELRERRIEESCVQKVAAVAAERDGANQQVLQLRKDRLLERAFSEAEGHIGGQREGDVLRHLPRGTSPRRP
jgi:hypothetical protein